MPDEEVQRRPQQPDTSVTETFTLTQDFTDSVVLETQDQYKTTLDIPPQFMKPLDTEITAKEGGSTT
jgi:SUMO ligase MMS21 Smc5/6 complex component